MMRNRISAQSLAIETILSDNQNNDTYTYIHIYIYTQIFIKETIYIYITFKLARTAISTEYNEICPDYQDT